MNSVQSIQHHIEKILTHLEPLLPLANCHMVDFFTENIFHNYLSLDIRNEIACMPHTEVIRCIFERDLTSIPVLQNYFKTCKKFSLLECPDICMNLEQCFNKIAALGCMNINRFKLDVFMSQKKSHEVEILSSVAAAVKEIGGTTHVIDIGDGKGYLSSFLALHHKIPVLGIDSSIHNSNAAVKRVHKLEKVWHRIYDNPHKSVPKKSELNFTPSNELYKQVTKFVEPDVNFNEIAFNIFKERIEKISLVGLHTCGNLAATCIKIFDKNEHVKTLANVGCCYHLLTERFEHSPVENIVGFPLSRYLIEKKITIGRNARMVAAQSVNRIFEKKELPDASIFYRALLQVLLVKTCKELPTKTVGKMRKKYTSFPEYAKIALKKLELDVDILKISDNNLEDLYNEYRPRLDELNIFYLIRCMTSPVIESLILLDRLLFLLENGHEKSFLVQLFDPVVSPRCYGVISIKI